MADYDYDSYGGSPRFSPDQARRLVNIAGAVCSLGLIVGVGIWGYNLAVRDVTGIPVIRAAQGPMRIAPANPGGEIADHQGMAINAVAELRPSDTMPDEIVLAPAPIQLSLEDTAGLVAPSPLVVEASAPAPLTALAPRDEPLATETLGEEMPIVSSTDDAVALALEAVLAGDEPSDVGADVGADAGADGLARSPRPMPRPGRAELTSVETVAASAVAIPEMDPAQIAIGTRLVQLGAFDTADDARTEWVKLFGRFGDLMSGKSMVLQTAESGGRSFVRLRAYGFDGEDDARRFCAALVAENAACIPAAHR